MLTTSTGLVNLNISNNNLGDLGTQIKSFGRGLSSNKTLTQFLASHTSEDNKSFEDILEKINKKRREKNAKLFDAKKIQ